MAASPDTAPGLIFSPPYVDATVRSPLLNVEFSQVFSQILTHWILVNLSRMYCYLLPPVGNGDVGIIRS